MDPDAIVIDQRPELSYDQFVVHLRSALHYLYDPVHLRRSVLVELLGLQGAFDQAAALQQTLSSAIRTLKPPDDEPPQSRAWRIYDILSLQYLRQLGRDAVANQLGISERQMRREQRLAIEALAQQLWQAPEFAESLRTALAPAQESIFDSPGRPAPDAAHESAVPSSVESNLGVSLPELRIRLGEALENVRTLAQPLAQQLGVALEIYIAADLLALPMSPMALRTILLAALMYAIRLAGSGAVAMTATRREGEIAIAVTCHNPDWEQEPLDAAELRGLSTVQEQAAFYDTRLEVAPPAPGAQGQGALAITLLLAAPEQTVVLVVDDNVDWLELVQRYAAGTDYQVVTTNAPATACSTAGKLQPAAIVLDVMMHNVDGWHVLSELRHDPSTAHIPVIVCTILPLEQMALALGATAFLQKPASQQQFLHAMERLGVF
jgi:CheY-like chemotaxis protein